MQMIVRIGKHAAMVVLAAAIVAVLLIGGLAARLAAGPIPMGWAVPYIQQGLQGAGGIPAELSISDLSLAWNPDSSHIEFAAHHVTVTQQQTSLTAVDQIGMTFSVVGLLAGHLQLKDLVLNSPHFQFVLGASAGTPAATETAISDTKSFLQHLHSVTVRNGTLDIQHADSNVHDMVDHLELKWKRNLWSSAGTLSANLQLAGSAAASSVAVTLKEERDNIQLSAGAKNILPADLQFILDHTAPSLLPPNLSLDRWQMATSLDTHITLSPQGLLQQISGTLTADKGQILLPEFYSAPVPLGNLHVKGSYDALRGNWQVDQLTATIEDADGTIPLTATADGSTTLHTIHGDATLGDLTVSQMKRWWPSGAAPGAIDWLERNLKDGKIVHLTAAVDLHAADGITYAVTRATAGFDLQNMSTTFLPGFPVVTGINGKATMDQSSAHFNIQTGRLGDIVLQPGTMDISGLDVDTQILKMDLPLTAQLATVLKLLDMPPYSYVKKMGVDAASAAGGVGMDLKMELPLLAALKISDVKYHAIANLSQVALPGALLGRDITRGQGILEIDPEHMKINGQADVSGVPMEFTWQDFTAPKDGITRAVTFSSELLDDDHARLSLPTAGRVTGSTKLTGNYEVRVEKNTSQGSLHAQMNLEDAVFHVDELSYQKPAGAPMTATADMNLGTSTSFKMTATAPDLTLNGSGELDGAMQPLKLDFPVAKLGSKNDAVLHFEKTGAGEHWTVSGNALDLAALVSSQSNTPSGAAKNTKPLALQIKLGTLYLANQNNLKNFTADMNFNGQDWDKVILQGMLHANAPFTINWDVNAPGHKLTVRTPDAGAALSALDITTAMIGGDLVIDGAGNAPSGVSGGAPGAAWLAHGHVAVKNFRMKDVPFLGRLIAAVSPGELLDKLRGKDGVGFDKLETNFDYTDSVLRLSSGKAHGDAIGMTFEGDINHGSGPTTLKMNGTFVPLYMVNGFLSGVPIIGDIINGKNGGGLLGFNYTATGPAANPNVSVNPLSAFAPGFLRDLFF